ncbi:class I adenylate-forming enzyme family protein [uncultured Roseobacter sp.]|uniref:class I adenylate-forming enzyme family protein n=1 Tax=uncultured Roseobacter sp. TaxID=114847 RepID=UPI0026105CA3|nr:class I adenylate-forming enzyme family protein [uncultured Roseobacter sp.]
MLSVFDEGPPAPCPAPFNMAAYVLSAADRVPDKDALLILGEIGVERWRYDALERAVRGTATGLLRLGLVPGDRMLMRLGNTVDFPLAYLGALAAGLVPVPTSAALTLPETAQIIADIQPRAVLQDPDVACADHPMRIDLQRLRGFRDLPPAPYDLGDPNRLGYIIYTSGTSGVPRAVAHAHRAIWARRMMFDGWYGLTAEDRVLHAGAFNWTYTLGTGLMDPWTVGATALIPAAGTAASALPGLLADHEVTIFAAAPGVYRQMLKSGDSMRCPALRHGLSAGEKLATRVADSWRAASGTEVFEAYGMSECSTFISGAPDSPAAAGALGQPQPGRRVALLGLNGPVPVGEEGTIAVHRDDPGLMLGYLDAEAETAARLQGDWFLTGDQAVMSQEGQITYLGRNDDMMNAGGYRVSPIEVETALATLPGITGVAVTDVEVKEDARVIAAFYTAPAALDETTFETYVKATLARYKQPRLFIHVPELPMGANGKILRRALRAGFEARND